MIRNILYKRMATRGNSFPLQALCFYACICILLSGNSKAQTPELGYAANVASTNSRTGKYEVSQYDVKGYASLPPEVLAAFRARHATASVSVAQIAEAAADLQCEIFRVTGNSSSIAFSDKQITNGVVTLYVFQAAISQIVVSGKRWTVSDLAAEMKSGASPGSTDQTTANTRTNATTTATNSLPTFKVRAFEIRGDTLLTDARLTEILTKYTGETITVNDIVKAASDLQLEYKNRGFPTVNVTLPPQQITNGIVKIRVFQGRLADISVTGNRYFSAQNIFRALPSLHSHTILNGPVFQSELDRANANQDRQIYPQIKPGSEVGTTDLILKVKDRLPLHGKIELNNQSSPGTPYLRVNTSVLYNNLWQSEHAIGLQYSFSPRYFKTGSQWNFYDKPLVANYSGFYRLPIGNPEPVARTVASNPDVFGYDEASRKFRLPPPSGQAEINFYASRSTIDTGIEKLSHDIIQDIPDVITAIRDVAQEDLTINNNLGFRLSTPLKSTDKTRTGFSIGLDFKQYDSSSFKTNTYFYSTTTIDTLGNKKVTTSTVSDGLPAVRKNLDYIPLSFRLDFSARDSLGYTALGLGVSGNPWYSGSFSELQNVVGSKKASGRFITISPSLTRELLIHTNWALTLRADGQWSNEPLLSNEQFSAGGINSVRGYHEGEVSGDTGWHISLEQKTPLHNVGTTPSGEQLVIRGIVFSDYAETYLLDPQGRQPQTGLWSCGFGGVASLGSHWDAKFVFSWPLMNTSTTARFDPRLSFSITGQF